MANKEPPVKRFRLSYDVEAVELGNEVALLAQRGRTNVNFELIEDIRTFNKKANYAVKSVDFLKVWVADHPTFKAIEVCEYFEENGRTRGGAYTAIKSLTEEKFLTKLDGGNYAHADVKHLAPPNNSGKRYAVSNGDFIVRCARRSNGRFNLAKIKELFEKDKRPSSSASPAINDLLNRKLAKRISDGEYVLLQKAARKKPKAVKPATPVKSNGADHVEAAHG